MIYNVSSGAVSTRQRQYESSWRCTYHSTAPFQTWADLHKVWQEVLHPPPHHPYTLAAACNQLLPVDGTADLQREEKATEAEEISSVILAHFILHTFCFLKVMTCPIQLLLKREGILTIDLRIKQN